MFNNLNANIIRIGWQAWEIIVHGKKIGVFILLDPAESPAQIEGTVGNHRGLVNQQIIGVGLLLHDTADDLLRTTEKWKLVEIKFFDKPELLVGRESEMAVEP